MNPYEATYLLSVVNHKETYELTEDITIQIDKSYENNLRERNPQLGIVEAVPSDNTLQLAIGDIVAVNHFTFYGDVGANRSFTEKEHVVLNGVKLFKAVPRQIFFKYNTRSPEPIGDFTLVEKLIEPIEHFGVYFGDEEKIMNNGQQVLTLPNALYSITLDKVEYLKVRKDEIVATVENGVVIPVGDTVLIEYLPEKEHALYGVKKNNNLSAKVLMSNLPHIHPGETIQVYRNQGVEYAGKRVIGEDSILWKYEEA